MIEAIMRVNKYDTVFIHGKDGEVGRMKESIEVSLFLSDNSYLGCMKMDIHRPQNEKEFKVGEQYPIWIHPRIVQ